MNWISIDYEKCASCGKCIHACPLHFLKPDNAMLISADQSNCNLCGHCVAICPEGAVTHTRMEMANFSPIQQKINFSPADFTGFIRQRRSHRHFMRKKIAQHDLETLVGAVRYAPTGGNDQNVELIVVCSPERIHRLSDLCMDYLADNREKLAADAAVLAADSKADPQKLAALKKRIHFLHGLADAHAQGFDTVFYQAPAVMVFHSTGQTPTPKDNCVIAATTMALLARTMGLESTFIGLFEHASLTWGPLIAELALPPGNKVFSTIVLGYPRIEYRTTVDRRPIQTRWE